MQQIGRPVTSALAATLGVFALGLLAAPHTAAQMQAWEDKGYLSVNYGYQAGDRSFRETLSVSIYDETATYLVDHASGGGGQFDFGGGVRVWRNLAAGVAITSFSTSSGATVVGSVPHPLFFNRPRPSSIARTDLEYSELGIHLQAVWVMPINEQISVAFAGGPSFFSVDQSLITSVTLGDEIAPFNNVTFSAAPASTVSEGGVGGNAGIDISYRVTERLGGGLFVRWARGTVDLPASGGTQSIDVGGFQSGIGLRIRF